MKKAALRSLFVWLFLGDTVNLRRNPTRQRTQARCPLSLAAPATVRPFFSEALNGNDPFREEIFKFLGKISLDKSEEVAYIEIA
jgi:hypothetical protein